MFCDEALDSVVAIAAGELTPDGRVAEHLATCPDCAAALAQARARRARWRSEQFLDAGFNVVVAVVVLAIGGGVWMLLHRSGLTAVSNDAVAVFSNGVATFARRLAPSVPLYAGATALLALTLGLWWWAERDAAL
jgi:hypothetical protein